MAGEAARRSTRLRWMWSDGRLLRQLSKLSRQPTVEAGTSPHESGMRLMYKATTEATHFLPRTGSHSTKGARNGRVDVLPPNAKMSTFGELEERYNRYRREFQEAAAAYKAAKEDLDNDAEWQRHRQHFKANKDKQYVAMPSKFAKKLDKLKLLSDRQSNLASKCQEMKVVFNRERNASYERQWIETARAMLPWDVVDKIEGVVQENWRRSCSPEPQSGESK